MMWTWRAGGVIGEDSDSELESRCVRVCARLEKGEETGPSESEVEGSECVTPVGVMMSGSEVEGSKCVTSVGEVLLGRLVRMKPLSESEESMRRFDGLDWREGPSDSSEW